MSVLFIFFIIATTVVLESSVKVASFQFATGWKVKASPQWHTTSNQQLYVQQRGDDVVNNAVGSTDSTTIPLHPTALDPGDHGLNDNQPIERDSVILASASEFSGIDSEDFYDYNDDESVNASSDNQDTPRTQSLTAKKEEKTAVLAELQLALLMKEELMSVELSLLKKLQTLRDRGEFVHDDLRTKEALCSAEEALRDEIKRNIVSVTKEIEQLEWEIEEESVHRRRRKLRQELEKAAEGDAWLTARDPLSPATPLTDEPILSNIGTEQPTAEPSTEDATMTIHVATSAAATASTQPMTPSAPPPLVSPPSPPLQEQAVQMAPTATATSGSITVGSSSSSNIGSNTGSNIGSNIGSSSKWDWHQVRSWDETTFSATAVDAAWVALRSTVLLSLGLVDVATGYVTSAEVGEVVQAVAGAGSAVVEIVQSAGDAWQSGTEVWRMQVTDNLDAQSDLKDAFITTCLGVKGVLCSPPVRKAAGNIAKTVAVSAASVANSGVHTSQRIGREFEASKQWNQGITGIKASVPLLCALLAASALKGFEETTKSMF